MKKIGIDARKYFDFGIGTYIQQLIANLVSLNPPHEFLAYFSQDDEGRVSLSAPWQKSFVSYRKYSLSEFLFLGQKANNDGIHVLHIPHYTLPLGFRNRSVVTIHDLIHIRFPRFYPMKRAYALAMLSHAIKRSSCIIVDSEFTKVDILKSFAVDEKKIEVIYLGIRPEFKPLKSLARIKEFRARFQLRDPYILFVGNTMPHKGLGHLIKAFALLRNKETNLVIVGGNVSQNESLAALMTGLEIRDRVRELGRISTEDLVLAYNAADLLVLPSLYEGFGLPAIEAMACGTPVVSSDGGALPEILGDAAVVFDRGNTNEMAESIDEVLRNSRMRNMLVAEGFRNIRRFSWQAAAKKTLQVYERLM